MIKYESNKSNIYIIFIFDNINVSKKNKVNSFNFKFISKALFSLINLGE